MLSPRLATRAAGFLFVLMPLVSACAPIKVNSYTPSGAPLQNARTYRWADAEARATGDPRLDSNPFFERRMMAAAERALSARGFENRADDSADLVLHYHASVTQKLDVRDSDAHSSSSMYDAGTILLDFIDRRSDKLVWRAWAEGSIDGMIDDQAWLESHIDEAVGRIVATLPRRAGTP